MQDKKNEKKTYEKPVLRAIQLAEEEIMGVCKTSSTSSGPFRASCSICKNNYAGS